MKTESPRKSTPSGSLSSEPPEDTITSVPEDTIQTRRKRGRGDERDKTSKSQTSQADNAHAAEDGLEEGAEDAAEDDEAVRCICGLDEYPGPPELNDEDNKHAVRDGIEEPVITVADVTEDLAGFFLQCDVCKVWQHGGCVGIMNEGQSPDEYFCEECRKDLHKIFTAPNGYVILQLLKKVKFFVKSSRPVAPTRERGADQVSQGWLLQIRRNIDGILHLLQYFQTNR